MLLYVFVYVFGPVAFIVIKIELNWIPHEYLLAKMTLKVIQNAYVYSSTNQNVSS